MVNAGAGESDSKIAFTKPPARSPDPGTAATSRRLTGMHRSMSEPTIRPDPFGISVPLDDLLSMARVELEEARRRLLVSVELLDPAGPFGEGRFSQPARPDEELIFPVGEPLS